MRHEMTWMRLCLSQAAVALFVRCCPPSYVENAMTQVLPFYDNVDVATLLARYIETDLAYVQV